MDTRAKLQAKLFSQRQTEEDSALFIARKVALFKRLEMDIERSQMTRQIQLLLKPQIKIYPVGVNVASPEQLARLTTEVEANLKEIQLASTYQGPTSREVTRRLSAPPYPCQFCGGHFNQECPREASRPRQRALPAPPPDESRSSSGNRLPVAIKREPPRP